jgi:hypothetical protein
LSDVVAAASASASSSSAGCVIGRRCFVCQNM